MRKTLFSFLLLVLGIVSIPAKGQHYGGSISYARINIPQWKKAINIYNFSRPYLSEPLETYTSNFSIHTYWLNRPYRNVVVGPKMSFTRKCLSGSAPNLQVDIHLQQLELGSLIRLRKVAFKKDLNSFFIDLSPGIMMTYLARRHNGKTISTLTEEANLKRVRSLGMGITGGVKMGYSLYLTDQLLLSPYLEAHYSPYLLAGNSINVLNQTAVNGLRDRSAAYSIQVGIELSFCKTDN